MKKLIYLLCLIPALAIGQAKTVISSNRVFPRSDKAIEFDKALANHAQKYHKGDVAWRVWSIESGPDAGGYMLSEGPNSWANLDTRGDISNEHSEDWAKNVMPLATDRWQAGYYDFMPDLSTVQLTDYADKIVINHLTPKPGMTVRIKALIAKLKKVREASGESVAVYSAVASGEPGYVEVMRLKGGMKELATDFRKTTMDRFNEIYGPGSFDAWLKEYSEVVQNRWSELLLYKPALSSK